MNTISPTNCGAKNAYANAYFRCSVLPGQRLRREVSPASGSMNPVLRGWFLNDRAIVAHLFRKSQMVSAKDLAWCGLSTAFGFAGSCTRDLRRCWSRRLRRWRKPFLAISVNHCAVRRQVTLEHDVVQTVDRRNGIAAARTAGTSGRRR